MCESVTTRCYGCIDTRMNPRGWWRRRRNLRRVPTTSDNPDRGGAKKTVRLGVVCRPGSPFLSVFFLKSQMNSSQKSSKKGLTKKKDKQTSEKIWSDLDADGTRFWTAKCQIPVAKPLKSGPQNEQRISLKNPTNEHLRLASVVGTLLKLRLRRNNRRISKVQ